MHNYCSVTEIKIREKLITCLIDNQEKFDLWKNYKIPENRKKKIFEMVQKEFCVDISEEIKKYNTINEIVCFIKRKLHLVQYDG